MNLQIEALMKDKELITNEKSKALSEISKYRDENLLKQARISALLSELVEKRKIVESIEKNKETHIIMDSDSTILTEEKSLEQGHEWQLTVIDADGKETDHLSISNEIQEVEKKLEKFYLDKFNSLNNIIKVSDSRVIKMFQIQEKLEKQMAVLKQEKEELNKSLQAVHSQHSASINDYDSTKVNYDQQLNLLSEHVVHLTQKIASTEEELETIKAYKVRCGRCKTWNTVGWLITEGKNGQYCSRGNHPSSFNFA